MLTPSVEKYLSISLNAYGEGMFARPQFLLIIALTLAAVVYMLNMQRKTRLMSAQEQQEVNEAMMQAAPGFSATAGPAPE